MRIFHTSDWHLGQTLFNYERYYEHEIFLDWLLQKLTIARPEVLLISGDIFDNSNPSAESQRRFYQFLSHAQSIIPAINIIIIAGNHDSPGRLEAPAPLLHSFGITVIGSLPRINNEIDLQRLIVPLKNINNDIIGYCIAIPFIRPGEITYGRDGASYRESIHSLYQQVLELALNRKEKHQVLLEMAHCNINGCKTSDSERKPIIGGSDALPAEIFDARLDYVALGHLHRAQTVAEQDWIRYSGSPLPMSFSEINYQHQILQIDIEAGGPPQITSISVPRPVEFLRIPEQHEPLDEVLAQLQAFRPPKCDPKKWPYLQVQVQVTGPHLDLSAQIEEKLKNKSVRLSKIDLQRPATLVEINRINLQSLDEVKKIRPDEIFRKVYLDRYHAPPNAELLNAFNELWQTSEQLTSE